VVVESIFGFDATESIPLTKFDIQLPGDSLSDPSSLEA
jgi:hypothetical protein